MAASVLVAVGDCSAVIKAIAERMRFAGYIVLTLVMAALIYPVFGHWAWGGLDQGEAA